MMTKTELVRRGVGYGLAGLLALAMAFLIWRASMLDAETAGPLPVASAISVGDQAEWLLDFGTIAAIDATTYPEIVARMTPSNGKVPGVGLRYYQGGKLWLHFVVPELDPAEGRYVVRLNNTRVREARMVLVKDGTFAEFDWTYDSPARRAGLETRVPAFAFTADELAGAEILFGFNSLGAMRGAVSIESERVFDAVELRQTMIYSTLLGVMWVLAAYLVVIGTRLGERSLVFAAGLAFSLGIFVYGVGGFVHFQLLAPWPRVADVVLYGLQPWPPAFWMLLAITYLNLPQRMPKLALVMTTLALLLPFQGILTLLTALGFPVPFITDNATPVIIGLAAGLILVIAFAVRGDRRAQALLWAFAPLGIGSTIRVFMYFSPVPDPTLSSIFDIFLDMVVTVVLLAVIVVLDIQRRETALRQEATSNEARFRAYAEIASDSYFETDARGQIVGSAGPLSRQLGLVEGREIEAAVAPIVDGDPEPVLGQFRRARNTGERISDLEVPAKLGEDATGWLAFTLVPFADETGTARNLRGTISDVTERVQRRDSEARQNTLSALGQLASGVAHEVNNLLHPMVNLAQRVRDKHTSDDEARNLLDLVVASGKHAGEIVAGVLNAFNPVRTPGDRQPIDHALIRALETVKPTVPATILIRETVEPVGDILVPPGEMLQVISNLLSNSIRAMDGSGTIEVALRREGADTVLSFADTGPGMPEHIRRRASEPFVTGRPEGTGLGLAVVANIARSWRGDVDIQSAPGAGTTIEIRIGATPRSS